MVSIDKRLNANEMHLLRQMIGRKIVSFLHDAFLKDIYSSFEVLGIETEQEIIYLYSQTEVLDYFGVPEDVAVWELTDERYPLADSVNFLSTPINQTVKAIRLVQENQRLYQEGQQTYDVWVTRGIIFDFGDFHFSLEKTYWIQEIIHMKKGKDLNEVLSTYAGTDDFVSGWTDEPSDDPSKDPVGECDREIVLLGEALLPEISPQNRMDH